MIGGRVGRVPRRLRRRARHVGLDPALPAAVELARGERRDVRARRLRAAPDDPGRPGALVRRRPRAAAARLRRAVRRALRTGRDDHRASSRSATGSDGPRGAGHALGLDAAPRHAEVRARMDLSPRSMASVWMVGLEDEPDRCGEICVFEVFGDAVEPGARGRGRHGRAPVPRPRAHRRLRDAAARRSTSPSRTPTPPSGGPAASTSSSTATHVRCVGPGARLPDADDGRRVRLPRARARGSPRGPRARARRRPDRGAA